MNKERLEKIATKVRYAMVDNMNTKKKYHIGGALSIVDILVFLYFYYAKITEEEDRDRIILSKGHSCYALYTVLAIKGLMPLKELSSYGELNSIMQGHPDMKRNQFIDFSTGSLGQGLSVGIGMALGLKYMKKKNKVFVIVGDGELQEGQIWEAFMAASKYNLDNIYCLVDANKLQVDGKVDDIMPINNFDKILFLMGWEIRTIEGHDFNSMNNIFKDLEKQNDKPRMIILNTIKGKGISFMENNYIWHSKIINSKEKKAALNELSHKC